MFEPLASSILPNCLMSNIKGGCFILKHNQRGSFFSLIASQARLGKFATKPFPTWWIAISRSGWKVIRAEWLRLAVIERVSQRRLSSREGRTSQGEKKQKMQSALIVQSQHERRRRELLQQYATWGYSQWGINSDTQTETLAPFAYEFHHREEKGASKTCLYADFLSSGWWKTANTWIIKGFAFFFFTFRLVWWKYMKAVCFWQRLMPPLSVALPTSVAFDYVDFQGARAR